MYSKIYIKWLIGEKDIMKIEEVARKINIDENDLEFYGKNKAKINYTNYINRDRKGKLILVTAITPTKQGEGKTTMSIGIADGLRIYRKKCYCCTKRAIFRSCIWTKRRSNWRWKVYYNSKRRNKPSFYRRHACTYICSKFDSSMY